MDLSGTKNAQNIEDEYKLRATLLGHSSDVRGVTCGVFNDSPLIASVSRDKTTKLWAPTPGESGENFSLVQSIEGHKSYIACVFLIPPSVKYPSGLLLTGGHDNIILGFDISNATSPIFRLESHTAAVCCISGLDENLFVSGSWDATAKIWDGSSCVATLSGHSATVWAVGIVKSPSPSLLTASADKEIRLWDKSNLEKSVRIFKGHTDCVRALVVVDETYFMSGGNDASIRLWNIKTGDTVKTFYGHTSFIYSLALHPNGTDFVSSGEDRTIRIWKNGECSQTIFLPALSVWSIAVLPNGDIVSGSSDGSVRLFTSSPTRFASPSQLSAFESAVSATTLSASGELGGMKLSELPGEEALFRPGRKEGETKMVRQGAGVACYSWSTAGGGKWNKIGDVVGAAGAGNPGKKTLHEGQEYDYVFQVELDDKSAIKLPFNITEDPWHAAQKFIDKNNLGQMYLEQVANFIIKNTEGVQLGTATSEFADPFTGESRYVPGSGSQNGFGGSGGGVDPFTGSGAYTTSSSSGPIGSNVKISHTPCFPISSFIHFTTPPAVENLKKKLVEFMEASGLSSKLDPNLFEDLLSLATTPIWTERVEYIIKTSLEALPQEHVFPVLDLLRMGVLNSEVSAKATEALSLTTHLVGKYLGQGEYPVNQLLYLRLLSNLFGTQTQSLLSSLSSIIAPLISSLSKQHLNQRAAGTLLLNYSIVVNDVNGETEILMGCLSLLDLIEDEEGIYRVLVGLGNIVTKNKKMGDLLVSLGGPQLLESYAKSPLDKIRQCVVELQNTISVAQ